MRILQILLAVLVALSAVACDEMRSASSVVGTAPTSLASCNDHPPGQQPSGNPAQAPGNSSSNDHDCKN